MAVFEDILAARAAEAGLALTEAQIAQFVIYNNMLVDWNTRMNLTALTAPEDVAVKHIIDSLTAYDPILFDAAETLIDVGTGAGLPGIPLAVYVPHIHVTLMDALQKRVRFLTEVTAAMGLTNTRCIHARAEEAAHTAERSMRVPCTCPGLTTYAPFSPLRRNAPHRRHIRCAREGAKTRDERCFCEIISLLRGFRYFMSKLNRDYGIFVVRFFGMRIRRYMSSGSVGYGKMD